MMERLLILFLFIAVAMAGYVVWHWWQKRHLAKLSSATLPQSLSNRLLRHGRGVIYFTADHCAQCKLQQTPILDALAATTDVQILKVDAVDEPDLARFFGVMTVPTTVVLGQDLRPSAVNHGLVTLPRLQRQINAPVSR